MSRYFYIFASEIERLNVRGQKSPNFLSGTIMIKKEEIEKIVSELLEKDDFLVSVTVSSANKIIVLVDNLNGFSIDKCVRMSRHIESKLNRDQEDYELEVSTPGLNTPFTVREQFLKHIGKEVQLYISGKPLTGILLTFDNNGILFRYTVKENVEGKKKKQTITKEEKIDVNDIKWIKPVIKFR